LQQISFKINQDAFVLKAVLTPTNTSIIMNDLMDEKFVFKSQKFGGFVVVSF